MTWDRWRERLAQKEAGQKIIVPCYTSPDSEDEGFYRKPITEPELNKQGKTNGRKKIIGWEPIAYFLQDGQLVGVINNRDMTPNEMDDLWSWCVQHPIREDWYRAVSERGKPWPDLKSVDIISHPDNGIGDDMDRAEQAHEIPAANRDVAKDDNASDVLPEVAHATAIDNAISAAIKKVTNETEAAQALGSKNRIAELRLAADKAGKAEYEPPYVEYKHLYGEWNPMVKRAEAKEKELNTIILTYRQRERERIDHEAALATQARLDEETRNRRAADRAIVIGEPEPPPIVEEVAQPAPLAPVAPTYGTRKLKEEIHQILESVTDFDAVYVFLKNEPKVKALLTELATAKVKAGYTVPGCAVREGLI